MIWKMRHLLCATMLAVVLLPNLAIARQDDELPCRSDDYQCILDTMSEAIYVASVLISAAQQTSEPWMAYNSTLLGVEWKFDQNALVTFSKLFPNLYKLARKKVFDKYGIDTPAIVPKQVGGNPSAGPALYLTMAFNIGNAMDDFNQAGIDAMTRDLMARGWPEVLARTESNYQFLRYGATGDTAWERGIRMVGVSGTGPFGAWANLRTLLRILGSGEYYNLWATVNHSQVRTMIEDNITRNPGMDPGRSYMEWAARQDGSSGVGARCAHVIYVPPGVCTWIPSPSGGTLSCEGGYYRCIQ